MTFFVGINVWYFCGLAPKCKILHRLTLIYINSYTRLSEAGRLWQLETSRLCARTVTFEPVLLQYVDTPIVCSVSTIANFELRPHGSWAVPKISEVTSGQVNLMLWLWTHHYLCLPSEKNHTNQLPSTSHSVSLGKRCAEMLFSASVVSAVVLASLPRRKKPRILLHLRCCLPAEAFTCSVLLGETLHLNWILQLERCCVQVYEAWFKLVSSRVSAENSHSTIYNL